MKKLMMFVEKNKSYFLTLLFFSVVFTAFCQPWGSDTLKATIPLKPDFSSPQATIATVGAYLGSLIVIAIGYIPFVRTWASSVKGYKALKIAFAAIPVLVVVFMFGFKGDVVQIVLNTIWSILGGLGTYDLVIKPKVTAKEVQGPGDVQV